MRGEGERKELECGGRVINWGKGLIFKRGGVFGGFGLLDETCWGLVKGERGWVLMGTCLPSRPEPSQRAFVLGLVEWILLNGCVAGTLPGTGELF